MDRLGVFVPPTHGVFFMVPLFSFNLLNHYLLLCWPR